MQLEAIFKATFPPSRLGLKAKCRFTMLFGVRGSMLLCEVPSVTYSGSTMLIALSPPNNIPAVTHGSRHHIKFSADVAALYACKPWDQ